MKCARQSESCANTRTLLTRGDINPTPAPEVVKLVVAFAFQSSRLLGSFGLLGLMRIWVEVPAPTDKSLRAQPDNLGTDDP